MAPSYYIARSEEHGTYRIVQQAPYFVLLTIGIHSNREPSPEMAEFMNELNAKLLVCRAWYEKAEKGVVVLFEAPYMGLYKKDLFSEFFDHVLSDRRAMRTAGDCEKIFSSKE